MATLDDFLRLADEPFVSLTTFRKSGVPVATPVWIAREGDRMIVTTPSDSGKVKRLRNNSRVELRACSRTGAVREDAVAVSAQATVVSDPSDVARMSLVVKKKYKMEYSIVMTIEKLARRSNRARVILSISPA